MASKRKPVSIGCWIAMRTSITSPRFADFAVWTRPTMSAGVQAGRFGDLDLGAARPPGAVGELRHGQHLLGAVQPHAGGDLGTPGPGSQVKSRHERPRIAPGEQRDGAHVV